MHNHTLIIGYGNRLRGDDGVGPMVAEVVQAWNLPGVKTLAVTQLVPELVEEIALAQRVLFIDASRGGLDGAFSAYPIEPRAVRRSLGHHDTPPNLLAMVRELAEHEPSAWMLEIRSASFEYGEVLTETARNNIQAALDWIRVWHERSLEPCTKPD